MPLGRYNLRSRKKGGVWFVSLSGDFLAENKKQLSELEESDEIKHIKHLEPYHGESICMNFNLNILSYLKFSNFVTLPHLSLAAQNSSHGRMGGGGGKCLLSHVALFRANVPFSQTSTEISPSFPIPHPRGLFVYLFIFRAAVAAYGSSQAMGQIRAAAASHSHSHSHTGSGLHLRPTLTLV